MSLVMSIVGMIALLAIAFLLSDNRKAINIRTVGGAFAIQFLLGAFVLYVPWGVDVLNSMTNGIQYVIDFGNEGIGFIFGGLVSNKMIALFGDGGFVFAFRVLPTIIFFSALISVLYYIGIMQVVIKVLGGALHKALGTSRAESMSATANIFVGQTEAPLVVRPFVPKMTKSELFAVMCGGLASIAGGVMASYAGLGVPLGYLIAASFMAAPGGLLFAKMIKPETEEPVDQIDVAIDDTDNKPANVIDAAATGASSGLQLALNVGAMLLAFVGLIALINGILGGIGAMFGYNDSDVLVSLNNLSATFPNSNDLIAAVQDIITKIQKNNVDFLDGGTISSIQALVDINRDQLIQILDGLGKVSLSDNSTSALQATLVEAKRSFSMELILGYLFAPLAWLIGVPWSEATIAGTFIGQKTVLNEFVAYSNFAPLLADGAQVVLSEKTKVIISFALCGFANLSSIAILLGGLGGLAPSRRSEIASMGMKAIAAGTLSNLMAATIAGFFLTLSSM